MSPSRASSMPARSPPPDPAPPRRRRRHGDDRLDDRLRSSLRGLSFVTIAVSASSDAIRPICGRFSRSRSPPQPNTQITGLRSARARRAAASGAPGACGRSRRSPRTADPRRSLETARDSPHRLEARLDRLLVDAEQTRRRYRAERVLDVEAPAQLQVDARERSGPILASSPKPKVRASGSSAARRRPYSSPVFTAAGGPPSTNSRRFALK